MNQDEFATFRNERINSNVGQIICEEMNPTKKTTYWRMPTTPRNYDCSNVIGCTTEGDYPNIEGKWYQVYSFDTNHLTKLYEMGNAKVYGYL